MGIRLIFLSLQVVTNSGSYCIALVVDMVA